jgi:hypothetical protein
MVSKKVFREGSGCLKEKYQREAGNSFPGADYG